MRAGSTGGTSASSGRSFPIIQLRCSGAVTIKISGAGLRLTPGPEFSPVRSQLVLFVGVLEAPYWPVGFRCIVDTFDDDVAIRDSSYPIRPD